MVRRDHGKDRNGQNRTTKGSGALTTTIHTCERSPDEQDCPEARLWQATSPATVATDSGWTTAYPEMSFDDPVLLMSGLVLAILKCRGSSATERARHAGHSRRQQAAQKRTALFADVSEPLLASAAGIFAGNQPQVAGHLFAALETLRGPHRQRERQRRDRSHALTTPTSL